MPEVITSRKNEWIRYAVSLASDAQARRREGKFFAEGARLCRDAAQSGVPVTALFYTEQARRKYAEYLSVILEKAESSYEIAPHVAELLAGTKTAQGVFCVCAMRSAGGGVSGMEPDKPYLALENLQDPGNLGAVLRTAEALGTAGILLAGNCCDVYSPKVLRASMGAVFRVPFFLAENMAEAAAELNKRGFETYAAVPDSGAEEVTRVNFHRRGVLVVGNEGNGLLPETAAACARRVTIPMRGRAESLNAAACAAILMWEQVRANG